MKTKEFHFIFINVIVAIFLCADVSAADVQATPAVSSEKVLPADLQKATIVEKLGDTVDINHLQFTDENGKSVQLSQYFTGHRPVILSLVYYGCPNLCTFVLNGLTDALRSLSWNIGEQFEVVTVSIDPKEDGATVPIDDKHPEEVQRLSLKKQEAYSREYGRFGVEKGWHFLTGKQDQIAKLASEVGFGYYYDKQAKEYAHSAAIFVLTPTGKISRIFYGIDFPSKDIKLSLLEASDGKIGTIVDRFIMFCYHYDPLRKGYSVYAFRVMQIAGALSAILLGLYLLWFWRRELRRSREKINDESNPSEQKRKGSLRS